MTGTFFVLYFLLHIILFILFYIKSFFAISYSINFITLSRHISCKKPKVSPSQLDLETQNVRKKKQSTTFTALLRKHKIQPSQLCPETQNVQNKRRNYPLSSIQKHRMSENIVNYLHNSVQGSNLGHDSRASTSWWGASSHRSPPGTRGNPPPTPPVDYIYISYAHMYNHLLAYIIGHLLCH